VTRLPPSTERADERLDETIDLRRSDLHLDKWLEGVCE
jgi:hypothetical protein